MKTTFFFSLLAVKNYCVNPLFLSVHVPLVLVHANKKRPCLEYHFVVYYPSCSSEGKCQIIYFISHFLPLVTFSCLFFSEVLASPQSLCSCFYILTGTWKKKKKKKTGGSDIDQISFWRQKLQSSVSILDVDFNIENTDWRNTSFFVPYFYLKGDKMQI